LIARFIPTPTVSQITVGPLTIHAYALCIILGATLAVWLTNKRFISSGGNSETVTDLALWVIPGGVIGARLYHVITSPEYFFGANGKLSDVFKIWEGGLGIWGAIAGGAIATFFALKKRDNSAQFLPIADALAPGLLLAQAIGRLGNWFNGELFGKPSSLPWALNIPIEKRPIEFINFETFHPTFLYESLWCVGVALILFKMNSLQLKPGSIFIAYISMYTLGRTWIEALRIDDAHLILGLRLNVWISLVIFLWSTALLINRIQRRNR